MKAAVIIADGVSARNFLIGDLGTHLNRLGSWSVVHGLPPGFVDEQMAGASMPAHTLPLPRYHETPAAALLRYSLLYGQMEWSGTRAMRHNLSQPVTGSWRRRGLHRTARLFGRVAAGPQRLALLDAWHSRIVARGPEVDRHRSQLAELDADVVLCTHQRPPSVVPPVLAARQLDIPTAAFIFSWDNLSSKGRIAVPFDHYLVWSGHMADDLRRYYPEIPPERVHVVGTPQFDPYAATDRLWSREELCRQLGADPARPLICFSGGDAGNSPEDPDHLRILLQLIRARRIRADAQVVLRPAPVDDGRRFDAVRAEHPELLYAPPAWTHDPSGDWTEVLPTRADVELLANLTHHVDLNVNMASTMTLDFALHDRPVVNLAFDVADPPRFGVPIWDFYYQFEHYRPVVKLAAARFARSPDDLADQVTAYLDDPTLDAAGRAALTQLEVGTPVGSSGSAIAEVLDTIARSPARSPA